MKRICRIGCFLARIAAAGILLLGTAILNLIGLLIGAIESGR